MAARGPPPRGPPPRGLSQQGCVSFPVSLSIFAVPLGQARPQEVPRQEQVRLEALLQAALQVALQAALPAAPEALLLAGHLQEQAPREVPIFFGTVTPFSLI